MKSDGVAFAIADRLFASTVLLVFAILSQPVLSGQSRQPRQTPAPSITVPRRLRRAMALSLALSLTSGTSRLRAPESRRFPQTPPATPQGRNRCCLQGAATEARQQMQRATL